MKLLRDLLGWYVGLAFFVKGGMNLSPGDFYPITAFGMLLVAFFLLPPSFRVINRICKNEISGWLKAGIIVLLLIGIAAGKKMESKNYEDYTQTNLKPQIVGNWK